MMNNKGAPPQAAAKKSMGSRAFVGAPLQPPEQCGRREDGKQREVVAEERFPQPFLKQRV